MVINKLKYIETEYYARYVHRKKVKEGGVKHNN